jgi:hypothetical protein
VATLLIEAKRAMTSRDVDGALEQLDGYAAAYGRPAGRMLVARYLAPPIRERLEERGVAYADATGNLFVVSETPGLFIRADGADRDPWRGRGRPRGTLKGAPAARVVRALVDHAEPLPMRRLVELSGASTGAAYRVVDFLTEEDLAGRDGSGRVEVRSWRRLLERWSRNYAFGDHVGGRRYLAPRGLPTLEQAMNATRSIRYAVTGSLAARHWAPYAPPRLAMVYVDDPTEVARSWDLRPVDSGANVLLGRPDTDVPYQRTVIDDGGLILAAPAQVAVDLMTGPGRNPAEAEYLLDWMEGREADWRR